MNITYIQLVRGWMYLVAIMDWYSRYVVGWELDTSDQGSQFTGPAYIKLVTASLFIPAKTRALAARINSGSP